MLSLSAQFFLTFGVGLLRFTLPSYYQVGLGLTPTWAGFAMLVRQRSMTLVAFVAGCWLALNRRSVCCDNCRLVLLRRHVRSYA